LTTLASSSPARGFSAFSALKVVAADLFLDLGVQPPELVRRQGAVGDQLLLEKPQGIALAQVRQLLGGPVDLLVVGAGMARQALELHPHEDGPGPGADPAPGRRRPYRVNLFHIPAVD
jgi:hypothetical protein